MKRLNRLVEKNLQVVKIIAQVKPYSALNVGAAIMNCSFESLSINPNRILKIPFDLSKLTYKNTPIPRSNFFETKLKIQPRKSDVTTKKKG